jgi:hypothetical protein
VYLGPIWIDLFFSLWETTYGNKKVKIFRVVYGKTTYKKAIFVNENL